MGAAEQRAQRADQGERREEGRPDPARPLRRNLGARRGLDLGPILVRARRGPRGRDARRRRRSDPPVAVYTDISDAELEAFLARYDVGAPLSFKGIAEGVENSNFLLETDRGRYVLTIYERRVRPGGVTARAISSSTSSRGSTRWAKNSDHALARVRGSLSDFSPTRIPVSSKVSRIAARASARQCDLHGHIDT